MTDVAPTEGHITLDEAHVRVAAGISDREVPGKLVRDTLDWQPTGHEAGKWSSDELDKAKGGNVGGTLHWAKRRLAVLKLQKALCDGALVAFVRDPQSFGLFQLTAADWRGAAFARETIIGGCVRASTGEEINRHNGWRVLVQKAAFDNWFASAKTPTTMAANTDCLSWLKREMQNSPDARPRQKAKYREQAKQLFNVSGRMFDDQWTKAIEKTGAAVWARSGRPKSKQ